MVKKKNSQTEIWIVFKDKINRGKASKLLDKFGLSKFPQRQPKRVKTGLTAIIVSVPFGAAKHWLNVLSQKEEVVSARELTTSIS